LSSIQSTAKHALIRSLLSQALAHLLIQYETWPEVANATAKIVASYRCGV
jgi:hypothetical protein